MDENGKKWKCNKLQHVDRYADEYASDPTKPRIMESEFCYDYEWFGI